MIYDIILCAVLAGMFLFGWHRGFLRTIWGLAAIVLTIVFTVIFKPYAPLLFRCAEPASTALLFISIRVLLALIYRVLNAVLKLPLLKQTNQLAGGIAELVIALAVIYAVLAATALIGTDPVENTTLCRYFYDNNLLLMLLGH